MPTTTIVYLSEALRKRWPDPLCTEWQASYPMLFDSDDARLVKNQPKKHFHEWFSAIYLFQRDGWLTLIEKYEFGVHTRKAEVLKKILSSEQQAVLRSVKKKFEVQLPDIFLFRPDSSEFKFAEIKGPTDRLSPNQKESHRFIEESLQTQIEILVLKKR